MGRARILGLTVALLTAVALTGCTSLNACPAIGWFNTIEVNLTGNADDVASLELCANGECAASITARGETDEPLRLVTQDLAELQTAPPEFPTASPRSSQTDSPAPTALPLMFSIVRVDERLWRISLDMAVPHRLAVRALSSTGDVLIERDVVLDWRRVGGSERCGGPAEAGPVSLDIPS